MSFTATELGIRKKAEELLKKGVVSKEEVDLLYKKIEDTKLNLKKILNTNDGISSMVEHRIQSQVIAK